MTDYFQLETAVEKSRKYLDERKGVIRRILNEIAPERFRKTLRALNEQIHTLDVDINNRTSEREEVE